MLTVDFVFFMLAFFIIIGSLGVILSNNPIYSVLFLIFAFLNLAGIAILLSAEFIAMVIIVVYIGAVAVLFLFVVMLVDIEEARGFNIFKNKYFFVSALVTLLLCFELIVMINFSSDGSDKLISQTNQIASIHDFSILLFDNYYYLIIICSILLTVAMMGAVVIAKPSHKIGYKQSSFTQNSKNIEDSVKVININNEEGIQ